MCYIVVSILQIISLYLLMICDTRDVRALAQVVGVLICLFAMGTGEVFYASVIPLTTWFMCGNKWYVSVGFAVLSILLFSF